MNEKQEKELYIINEAGEVQNVLNYGDRILRRGSIEYLSGQTEIKFNYVKANTKAFQNLGTDGKYVSMILDCIELGTGILKYSNGRIINTNGKIAGLLNKDIKTGYSVVRRLIKKEIIHRNRTRENGVFFTFNPFIAHCGKKVPKALYREFFDTEWRKYTDEL